MYKHLFLQGDVDVGKSTIIKNSVLPFLKDIGGYYTVKLFVDNKKAGFAIRPVKDGAFYNLRLDTQDIYKVPGLFLYKDEDSCNFKTDLFVRKATKYLKNSCNKKLIIMDEIGGLELKSTKFVKTLSKILKGNTPILGVIKANKNLLKVSKATKSDIKNCEPFLRKFCLSDNIKILTVNSFNINETKNKVCNFVHNVLT